MPDAPAAAAAPSATAAVDWRTPEERRADAALPERAWRCRAHGVQPFDDVTWVGEVAYCTIGDCAERLIGIGKPRAAMDPGMSAWSKHHKPPPRRGGRAPRIDETLDDVVAEESAPAAVDQIEEEPAEAGPPDAAAEPAQELEPDTDVDQVDAAAPELVHEEATPTEGSQEENVAQEPKQHEGARAIIRRHLETRPRGANRQELVAVVSEARPDFSPKQVRQNVDSALASLRGAGLIVRNGSDVTLASSRVPASAKPVLAPELANAAAPTPRTGRPRATPAKPSPAAAPALAVAVTVSVSAERLHATVDEVRAEITANIERLQGALAALDALDLAFPRPPKAA